jgi:hypothetical protein
MRVCHLQVVDELLCVYAAPQQLLLVLLLLGQH